MELGGHQLGIAVVNSVHLQADYSGATPPLVGAYATRPGLDAAR